jgi:hypothetical protein
VADNTQLNAGTGGDTMRDKDRSGVKTPIVAIDLNPAGSETLMAGSMPVTGTFWQTTQPVSGTVTANAGTGTFAISASALPLPTGASTAAKQPALGTAGTASTDVITVQGIASMTSLKVDGSGVTQPVSGTVTAAQATAASLNATVVGTGTFAVQAAQSGSWTVTANAGTNLNTSALALETGGNLATVAGAIVAQASTTSGQKGPLMQGAVTTSAPTYSNSQTSPLSLDTAGNLRVNVAAGGGSGGTSSSFGAAFPATGTAIGAKDSSGTNLAALNLDASGFLKVNVAAGGGSGGTSSSFGSAVPSTGTAAGYSDSTNMQLARVYDTNSGAGTEYTIGVNLRGSGGSGSVELATASNPLQVSLANTGANSTALVVTANAGTNLNTSSLALDTSVNGILLAQASTTSGQSGPLIQGACSTAAPTYSNAKTEPLSLDTSGNLRVLSTPSGTQTVSGTVTANAGTNLNTSALALDTSVNGVLVAQGSTTSGEKGPLIQGAVTTAAPSYSTTQTSPLSLDTSGNLRSLCTQTGTWNVGTVTTVSTVTAVTAITNALPAGTNLLGQVSASNETATIYNGTTALTPLFAPIVASSSGATTVVAAVASKKIRVLRWSLSSNGNVNVKWQSHVTPTDLTGLHYMTQYSTAGGAYTNVGIFQTIAGEALDINLSGAVAVGGELTYVTV